LGIPITWVGKNKNPLIRLVKIILATKESKATIIQSHHFFTNPYVAITGRILGRSDIGAIRNDVVSEIRANGNLLGNLCLHLPRRLAANSINGRKNAITFGVPSNHIDILPNVVDCEKFCPSNEQVRKPFSVLTIGRLVSSKKQEYFLESLARVKESSYPDIQGWIVGDGPLRRNLESRANELNLNQKNIHFINSVADPVTFYNNADVFLLTSDYEGTPNVVMEAMACGLPIIATRMGDVPELIRDGETGFLVKPGDVAGMTYYLRLLIEDPTLRKTLGTVARSFILEHYNLTQMATNLEAFYQLK
jgi:glycosyltransferase involved in cell wall biosynthesis